jgi:L-ascorbate metabolism protein UlaG (beta-lactamase superfamily)
MITDPTFDPPRSYGNLTKIHGPAIEVSEIGLIDIVLLSHDEHEDNLDHAGRDLMETVPVVLSTRAAARRHRKITGLGPWEDITLKGGTTNVTVTAVPAQHGPRRLRPMLGAVTGFVLEAHAWPTIYISGDNSSVKVGRKVARRFPNIELAILHAGGAGVDRLGDALLTMDARRCAQLAHEMPGVVIVPVHFDDWAHFREPRDQFIDVFHREGPGERLVVLERGVQNALA